MRGTVVFADRVDAGRRLATRLGHLRGEDPVVLGLPRGGVPVAAEVARALGAPMDVIVVRKVGVPFQPELAMGAVGEGGVRVVNPDVISATGVTDAQLAAVEARERTELERRARRFRGDRPRIDLTGRTALIVDDGIATGATARAACQVVRSAGARRVVLAVPVAPRGWQARLGGVADEHIALETPESFGAVGAFYADFTPTTDDDVTECLARAARQAAPQAHGEDVVVPAGTVALPGRLSVPAPATGVVVFAHGSGSSRHSPRNRYVAAVLEQAGLATLLFDLLTPAEEQNRANVFDTDLLADRLASAIGWLGARPDVGALPVGIFGASTGAAAALCAAAAPGSRIAAVVSRGGRPDLAAARLGAVSAPTLLIVGGDDDVVVDLNRRAHEQLHCERRLAIVPGATHLFEEPGTLEAAAALARDWFTGHLA